MRAVLVPCSCTSDIARIARMRGQVLRPDEPHVPCGRCADVGVLIDVRMPVLERQIIDAWWAEPEWHRLARWRAEATGRAGFFQARIP